MRDLSRRAPGKIIVPLSPRPMSKNALAESKSSKRKGFGASTSSKFCGACWDHASGTGTKSVLHRQVRQLPVASLVAAEPRPVWEQAAQSHGFALGFALAGKARRLSRKCLQLELPQGRARLPESAGLSQQVWLQPRGGNVIRPHKEAIKHHAQEEKHSGQLAGPAHCTAGVHWKREKKATDFPLPTPACTWFSVTCKCPFASKEGCPAAISKMATAALSTPCWCAALACKASMEVWPSFRVARMDWATWLPARKHTRPGKEKKGVANKLATQHKLTAKEK